jgi:hypothetical protein
MTRAEGPSPTSSDYERRLFGLQNEPLTNIGR